MIYTVVNETIRSWFSGGQEGQTTPNWTANTGKNRGKKVRVREQKKKSQNGNGI